MLKDLFVSEVRVKILKIMLLDPTKSYHVRAVVRAVGTEINAVRRELARLMELGLLRNRQSGNRIYYAVNTSSIYFPELLSLVCKEEGLGADIVKSQRSLGNVRFAMISKAFCRGRIPGMMDVDLFLVGNINVENLKKIVGVEQDKIGREINFTVMSEEDFLYRKRKNDNFVSRILAQGRIMLIGDEEEFCAI